MSLRERIAAEDSDRLRERIATSNQNKIAIAQAMRAHIGKPFTWGVCDCNTLALEAAQVMSGVDMSLLFGNCDDLDSAREFTNSTGLRLRDVLLKAGGEALPHHEAMSAGDVIVCGVPSEPFDSGHVYIGLGRAVSASIEKGVGLVDAAAARRLSDVVVRF